MNYKGKDGFINLDPAVASILGDSKRRNEERKLGRKERKRLGREKQKGEVRRGKRATYDLDAELIQRVAELAAEHRTTASQVAGLAIELLLDGIASGEVNLDVYKVKCANNPRYEVLLEKPTAENDNI